MKRLLLVCLISTSAAAGTPSIPATPAHQRIAAGATPATGKQCGIKSPVKVAVRALSTPLVGQDLTLRVTVANGADAGPVRTWLRLPPGLDAAANPEWTDTLAHGGAAVHELTVRVNSGVPLPITAKAEAAGQLIAEGYTTLYPLEVTPAGVRAFWSATNLRALDDQPRVIQLENGDRAEIIRGN